MKNFKKVLAMLLTLAMVLCMSITTFAESAAPTGSITIRNATKGATYTLYKVFDATLSGDYENISYTYAGELPENDYFVQDTNGTVTATEAAKGTDGNLSKDAVDFLTELMDGKDPITTTTATTTVLSFSDLAYGYYYIESSLDTVVTIDSTMPNVTVIDKNQIPDWDNDPPGDDPDDPENPNPGKVILEYSEDAEGNTVVNKVTENSVNYGDTVVFNIAIYAKAYVGEKLASYYYITDTMAPGFIDRSDVVVYWTGDDGVRRVIPTTNYTITSDDSTFDITLPFGERYGAAPKIEVEYSAKINPTGEDVVISGTGNLNTANYTYSLVPIDPDDPGFDPGDPEDPDYPDPDDPHDPQDPEDPDDPQDPGTKPYADSNKRTTVTYVYAIAIEKVDANDTNKKLADAHFNIANINATKNADGTYSFVKVDATTATDFVTDENGLIVLKGLEAGTYTVTETQAPAGYNKLTAPVSVDASKVGETTTTITTTVYKDADGNVVDTEEESTTTETSSVEVTTVTLQVQNQGGVELPSTGGMGTTIFYVLGGLLVAGASVLLITKKRMSVVK